jgi:hypothetical protein
MSSVLSHSVFSKKNIPISLTPLSKVDLTQVSGTMSPPPKDNFTLQLKKYSPGNTSYLGKLVSYFMPLNTSQTQKNINTPVKLDEKRYSELLFEREFEAEDLARQAGASPSLKAHLQALVPLGTMSRGFESWKNSFLKHIKIEKLRHDLKEKSEFNMTEKSNPASNNGNKVNFNPSKNTTKLFEFLKGEEDRALKKKPASTKNRKPSLASIFN